MRSRRRPLITELRDLRDELGLSQNAVAARAGLGQGHICQYENGQRIPGLVSLEKLAAALGKRIELVDLDPADADELLQELAQHPPADQPHTAQLAHVKGHR